MRWDVGKKDGKSESICGYCLSVVLPVLFS